MICCTVLQTCDRSQGYQPMPSDEKYAEVAWTVTDLTDVYDMTDEQAADFLAEHSRTIQERMTERGWDAIDDLARTAKLKRLDED